MSFISLRDLVLRSANRFKSGQTAALVSINRAWSQLRPLLRLGELVEPVEFKKNVLTLSCSSLAEASYLRLHKERIKREINSHLRKDIVKDIKFQVR